MKLLAALLAAVAVATVVAAPANMHTDHRHVHHRASGG